MQDDLEQEQQLEQLLEKAFDDPALRPQFLALLLNSDIYFLGSSSSDVDTQIEHTLSEGSQIQIKSWNKADGTEVIGLLIDQSLEYKQLQALKGKVGNIDVDSLENKKPIDLFLINSNDKEGLSHYLLAETKPFYVRQNEKKKGFFARLFS